MNQLQRGNKRQEPLYGSKGQINVIIIVYCEGKCILTQIPLHSQCFDNASVIWILLNPSPGCNFLLDIFGLITSLLFNMDPVFPKSFIKPSWMWTASPTESSDWRISSMYTFRMKAETVDGYWCLNSLH